MGRRGRRLAVLASLGAALVACSSGGGGARPGDGEGAGAGDPVLAGGAGTVFDTSRNAFALPLRTLSREERRAFAVGNSFFNDNWVTAPASTEGRDGLGPTFNAQSCSSCHFKDGRAAPPAGPDDPGRGLLLRLSVPGPGGRAVAVPGYGDQLQDRAVVGVPAEARARVSYRERRGAYADGTPYVLAEPVYELVDPAYGPLPDDLQVSPRVAPALIGVGLLEAVPEADVLARADALDADGDGISGRPNLVGDLRHGGTTLGRFGWKANVATVEQQVAHAFLGDIGITSSLLPDPDCPVEQAACAAAPTGGAPEIDDHKLGRVTFYSRTLAVPARRDVDAPGSARGEEVFADLGCGSCHAPRLRTGPSDIAGLADQVIFPYTDLLLHDLGPGLTDGRPDHEATGREWRTAPLWGLGLVPDVNGHSRYLHDGRARDLTEAVLWHGGEAEAAQRGFVGLSAEDRAALVAYLESL
ncbi:MAG: c-type cytochrome [Acidimicrobiia bacterium]|nr:c-type cytochrome [Acidimicrobiia bacterium]